MNTNIQVRIPAHVEVRELDGEAVLLNLESKTYFGLDKMGLCFLNALQTASSVQTACETLLEEYEVAPEILLQDMEDLVQKLLENGLIEKVEG